MSSTTKTHNTTTSPTRPTAHEEAPTSEEIVIGTVLADPKLASRVYARLGPEDLGEPRVAWIYEAAMELARKGEAVEPATVAAQLRATGRLDALGESPLLYLADLLDLAVATAAELDGHIVRIKRAARARRFEALVRRTVLALDGGKDPEVVFQELSDGLASFGGTLSPASRSDDSLGEIATDLMAKIETGTPRGWAWPWEALTESVGRLLPGRMWAIVGYSGSGKSVWMRSLALGLIFDETQNVPVVYMAIEEAGEDVLGLMACAYGGVDYRRFGLGMALTSEEVDQIAAAVNAIYNTGRFTLNRRKRWTPNEILGQIRAYVEDGKAGVVIIDHAHLIDYPGKTEKERDHQAGLFAERLHALADELGFVAIACYQPRKPETGTDEFRPAGLHEIRGTGRIVNIVENTLSPFRPWVEWDPVWKREKLDDNGQPVLAKPGAKGARLVQNYAYIQPGKRRIGGYGGGPVVLPFDNVSGRIYEER